MFHCSGEKQMHLIVTYYYIRSWKTVLLLWKPSQYSHAIQPFVPQHQALVIYIFISSLGLTGLSGQLVRAFRLFQVMRRHEVLLWENSLYGHFKVSSSFPFEYEHCIFLAPLNTNSCKTKHKQRHGRPCRWLAQLLCNPCQPW